MEDIHVTAIRVPDQEYRNWQHLAINTKTSVNQMVLKAMREYVALLEDRQRNGSYL